MEQRDRRIATRADRIILATAVPVGIVLFIVGQLGARTGITVIPFDPHHVMTQIVGLGAVLYGLMHWK
jgi:hypothetical protein